MVGRPLVAAPATVMPNDARRALVISAALTALLYVAPYGHTIGYPLVLLSTLAHESGHGFAALLTGGRFLELHIHANASGVAPIAVSGRVAWAIASAGGLVGPACAAAVAFFCARNPKASRVALAVGGGLLAVMLPLVVRGLFSWLFVGLVAASLLALTKWASPRVAQVVLVFLGIQLSLSVFSRGDYLFTEFADMGGSRLPSDVANMATALFLPYWFWGALCGGFSIAVLALGGWLFLRPARSGPGAAARPRAKRLGAEAARAPSARRRER